MNEKTKLKMATLYKQLEKLTLKAEVEHCYSHEDATQETADVETSWEEALIAADDARNATDFDRMREDLEAVAASLDEALCIALGEAYMSNSVEHEALKLVDAMLQEIEAEQPVYEGLRVVR